MPNHKQLKTRITDLRFGEQRDPQAGNTLDLREMPVGEPMPMSASTLNLRPTEVGSSNSPSPITTRPEKYVSREGSLRSRIRESISQPTHAFREQVPKQSVKESNVEGPVRQFFEAVPGVLPIVPAPNLNQSQNQTYAKDIASRSTEPNSKDVKRMGRTLFVVVTLVLMASLISRLTSSGESGTYHTSQQQDAVTPKQVDTPIDSGTDPGAEPPKSDPPATPATSAPTRQESNVASDQPRSDQSGRGGGSLDPKICATGPTGTVSETCVIVDPKLEPLDPGVQLNQ